MPKSSRSTGAFRFSEPITRLMRVPVERLPSVSLAANARKSVRSTCRSRIISGRSRLHSSRSGRTGPMVTGIARRQGIWESWLTRSYISGILLRRQRTLFCRTIPQSRRLSGIAANPGSSSSSTHDLSADADRLCSSALVYRPYLCRPMSVRERCESRETARRVRFYVFGTRSYLQLR